jgi:cellulose synthase/poly-beta-1,6-N-acetylglucosamine synthase-like glycosyltransferase
MNIQISVVVPTCRRPELLERCLAALVAQDFDPAAYEIIIADDAACDETRAVVERWAQWEELAADAITLGQSRFERAVGSAPQALAVMELAAPICAVEIRPCVRYVAVSGAHGPAAARNAGWRAARGAIVAFTDDDCIPDPGWLRAGVSAFTGSVAGVDGTIVVPLTERPTDYERDAAGLEGAEFATANCFYHRDVLDAVGGFDERFRMAWREDSDLFFTLLERGYEVARAPGALVVHPVRPAAWGVSLRQQRKSMFNALLCKKHPALYWQRIQPAPPWAYYASVGALLVGLAGAARGRRRGRAYGATLWALLTMRFCARRLHHTSRAPGHVAEMLITSALIPPLAIFWRVRGAIKFRVWFL